jgi:hypothetical protein
MFRAEVVGTRAALALSEQGRSRPYVVGTVHSSRVRSLEDREVVSERNTVSLGDYGAFFKFYEAQGMTRSELDDLFLWTAHPHFASLLLR